VLMSNLVLNLTDCFKEGLRLDVADRTADFGDQNVAAGVGLADDIYIALDFVCDVRDYLYGAAEVVSAALLVKYRPVDLSGRDVRVTGHGLAGKTLVVTD